MEKNTDINHGVYYDLFLNDPVVFVECPECLQEVGVSLINRTTINAENGYWRASFFMMPFCCKLCSKETQVKVKKRKRQKIHGAYILDKSDYDVGNGVKISRERYYANKYYPGSDIMNASDRVGTINKYLRFVKNTERYREEISWYLESKNKTMLDILGFFIECLVMIKEDSFTFFGSFHQREFPAFMKELGCTIDEAIESFQIMFDTINQEALTGEEPQTALGGVHEQ